MSDRLLFDPQCRRCPRLSNFLDGVAKEYPGYHAAPVPAFGDTDPALLIVGLAPGLHGANATGRPFTGDYAGVLLYDTLFEFNWSNQAAALSRDDGLQLRGCRITNAVKCVPPQNKPATEEIKRCNEFLHQELNELREGAVILALGQIAHFSVVRALGLKRKDYPFGHGAEYALSHRRWLIDSYHCSRYNTQTRRLTEKMFREVFVAVRARIPDDD